MTALRVDLVDQPEAFAALESEWRDLLADSAGDTMFLTWEWMHTWWTHLGRSHRLAVMTVRRGERLMGLAPFAVRRWRPGSLDLLPRLEFLGSGDVGSDYLDVIVRRGAEAPVMHALADALASRPQLVHLPQLAAAGAEAVRLVDRLQQQGWRPRVARVDVCPYIPLEGHTFESYLATLGASHRYNFRRRLRQLERAHRLRFERIADEARRREVLPTLVALHNGRWAQRGGSTAFHAPELVAFHDALSQLLLARGWLRLFVLSLDDRPAAVLYAFAYGGKLYFYQSGFDPAHARTSVGLVTMGLSIKAAIEEGLGEFDLLHGDEAYKFLWARRSRPIQGLELYPPTVLGTLSRAALGTYRALRALGRRPSGVMPARTHVEPDVVVPSPR
jgi:CelD/BcsL family acetyltransferase involved in cellulose biosynthesis